MRLRIKDVSMQNFQCHDEQVFEFSEDYNEFRGFNGVGKTTVLNAIVWCLIGEDYAGSKKPMVNTIVDGETTNNKTVVTTTIGLENEETEIAAELEVKRAFNGTTTTIYVNGIKHKKTEYVSYMEDKLGISMNEFGLLTNPNYISSMAWKDARNLIMGLVKSVEDEEVFKSSKEFDPIKEKVIEYGAERFRKTIHDQNNNIKNDTIPNLSGRIQSYSQAIKEVGVTKENLRELQSEKADIVVRLNTYDERMDREVEKSNASSKIKTEIGDLETKRNFIDKEISDISIEGKEIASEIKLSSNVEKIKNEKLGSMREEMNTLKWNVQSSLKNLEIKKQQVLDIKEKFSDEKAKEIEVATICPTCNQALPEKDVNDVKNRLEKEKNKN